jgi:hypothetical protein
LLELSRLGLLKDFGKWVYYKSKIRKGCVFNYTDYNLSRAIDVSLSKARVLRIFWINQGWCRFEKGRGNSKNLVFNNQNGYAKGAKWHKSVIHIYKNYRNTIDNICFQILQIKNQQFEFLKSISRELKEPSSLKALKNAKRISKNYSSGLPNKNDRFKVSFKGIAKMFGCSIKKFVQMKKLTVFRMSRQVCLIRSWAGIGMIDNGIVNGFLGKNHVYRVFCNEYVF